MRRCIRLSWPSSSFRNTGSDSSGLMIASSVVKVLTNRVVAWFIGAMRSRLVFFACQHLIPCIRRSESARDPTRGVGGQVVTDPKRSQFTAQGALDQVELDFRRGGGSHECDHLPPRLENAVKPADEGHHYPNFGFTVEYHDSAGKEQDKDSHRLQDAD